MHIKRTTEVTDSQTTYEVFQNGDLKGTFSTADSVIAIAQANELIEDLVQEASIQGICPHVEYK